ncbi:MAG: carbamoyltransferase C-terminal domain-containing protein [Pyrinomonadaceae bacterium]
MAVILGINAFHAGASAALLIDGKPVAAMAEERLNRVKYYANFPALSIKRCLEMGGVTFRDIDYIAVGRDAAANRAKKIEYIVKHPTKLLNLLNIKKSRSSLDDMKALVAERCEVPESELRFKQVNVEHHLAHIASAYFISPWDDCAGFSMDGSGDFVSCMLAHCHGNKIDVKKRIFVPNSMGSLYTMISKFIGYGQYGDEGKVMGLAPYGKDVYAKHFADMLILTDDGFELNPKYFVPFGDTQGMTITNEGSMIVHRHHSDYFSSLVGEPREPYTEITQREQDLSIGLQNVFEKGYMHMLNVLHRLVPSDKIAMAGGAVLNSVANGKMFDETPFKETVIQPASGDEGLALGAALYVSRSVLEEKDHYVMVDSYLGPEYSDDEIQPVLDSLGVSYEKLDRDALLEVTSDEIAKGNVVGWFQGRMEWGPRALGNRSILADPSHPGMKDILNARIKRREWFRPFAPSVLAERQAEIFEHEHPSPFMLHVYKIRPEWRERLVAVNHVDNTGRLQTVTREENPLYYDLIKRFGERSGVPVILNTSFNENEPIVCEPREAAECFLRTKMDMLVIGSFVCRKTAAQAAAEPEVV